MLNKLKVKKGRLILLSGKDYIKKSLELNLFFGRIMKEHMIFMEAGLLIIDSTSVLGGISLR